MQGPLRGPSSSSYGGLAYSWLFLVFRSALSKLEKKPKNPQQNFIKKIKWKKIMENVHKSEKLQKHDVDIFV